MTDCLERGMRDLGGDAVERRRETVMAWATGTLGLEHVLAEKIYALAEEERLAPVYAFQLVHCRIGVRALLPPDATSSEASAQQAPPGWVAPPEAGADDVVMERRLRQTFRRFRSVLETNSDPASAARAYLAEPDVGRLDLISGEAAQ